MSRDDVCYCQQQGPVLRPARRTTAVRASLSMAVTVPCSEGIYTAAIA